MANHHDTKLVERIRSGNREAFEQFLDLYEDKVFALVLRAVGPQDAEDIAQEALLEVYRSIGGFKGKSSLSTWVYRVAMNVCLGHRRKVRPDTMPLDDDLLMDMTGGDDPADCAVRNETKAEVESAIDSLSDVHRDVVILHELHGLTYAECAEVLGCPVGTVKSRLSNAFIKLRQLLKDYSPEGGVAI